MSYMKNKGIRFAASVLAIAAALALPVGSAYADLGDGATGPAAHATTTAAATLTGEMYGPAGIPSVDEVYGAAPAPSPATVPSIDAVFGSEPQASAPLAPSASEHAEVAPEGPRELQELAAEVVEADRPASVQHDNALAELDGALAGTDDDPIAGLEEESSQEAGPRRSDVHAAIASVVPGIRACAPGQNGRVVSVTQIFDASGRTRRATIRTSTAHVDPGQRSCMARAARDATVPSFHGDSFEVSFPVHL